MSLNVLVVAGWYPSHDERGRGIFVADQVAALALAGVRIVVVSPEPVPFIADGAGHPGDVDPMAPWTTVIVERPSLARPRHWGASSIPVARFPVARFPAARPADGAGWDPVDVAELQSRSLLSFGVELARTWPVDLVHAHTGLPDGVSAARLADRLGVPLVVTEHESVLETRLASERARSAYRELFGPGRRVVAVSGALARQIAELLDVPVAAVEVIPNSVDVSAFRPVGPEERDPDELLWVGSRKASKGIDRLLAAFALARVDRPALRLRLVGKADNPAEDDRLRTVARALGVEAAVAFEPPTDRRGVVDAMERAALFVHPSDRETFGVVAAEALASGLPVAAVPSGGVDEILGQDGAFGELASASTAPALASAIGRALDRRSEFDPLRLRAHAETHYAAPAIAARIIDLYRTMLPIAVLPDLVGSELGAGALRNEARSEGPLPDQVPFRLPSIVIGMRRSLVAARLAGLPSGLCSALSIVTSVGASPSGMIAVPAVGALREVDVEAEFRAAQTRAGGPLPSRSRPFRLARGILHPIRAHRLRALARHRPEMAHAARIRAIREAILALPPGDRVEILPINADDVVIVVPLLGDRVALYPNTLRGLADRWDEGQRPEPAPPDR